MVRLTDRPDMTLDVYRGRKTTIQQQLFQQTCIADEDALTNPDSRKKSCPGLTQRLERNLTLDCIQTCKLFYEFRALSPEPALKYLIWIQNLVLNVL